MLQIILIRLQAPGYWTAIRIIRDGFTIMVPPSDLLFNCATVNLPSQQWIRARFIAQFGSSLILFPYPLVLRPYYVILTQPTLFRRSSTIAVHIQVLFHASEQADRKWESNLFFIIYKCTIYVCALYTKLASKIRNINHEKNI